jgi:hypothetical protein
VEKKRKHIYCVVTATPTAKKKQREKDEARTTAKKNRKDRHRGIGMMRGPSVAGANY